MPSESAVGLSLGHFGCFLPPQKPQDPAWPQRSAPGRRIPEREASPFRQGDLKITFFVLMLLILVSKIFLFDNDFGRTRCVRRSARPSGHASTWRVGGTCGGSWLLLLPRRRTLNRLHGTRWLSSASYHFSFPSLLGKEKAWIIYTCYDVYHIKMVL